MRFLLFIFFFISLAAHAGTRVCYKFEAEAPRYLSKVYLGPGTPTAICFTYPMAATRYFPRTHARFYMVGQYTGVFMMGPLDFANRPACTENCVAMKGEHFESEIDIDLLIIDSNTAELRDLINGKDFNLIQMSDAETDRILNF